MLRVTLRSFWAHKRRLVSTVVAIVLGVAFMAGTFVLTDTLDQVFDDLFAEGNAAVDAQVQGDVLFSDPFGGGDQRQLLDAGLVEAVAAVDGVAAAEPYVITVGFGSANRVLDPEGDPVGASAGPPTLVESWIPGSTLTPYRVADGRGPEADDEMALNVAAADDAGFEVGDSVTMVSQLGSKEYTLVGNRALRHRRELSGRGVGGGDAGRGPADRRHGGPDPDGDRQRRRGHLTGCAGARPSRRWFPRAPR